MLLVVTLLAGVFAFAASFLVTPTYSSAGRVLVRARDARFLSSTGEDVASRPGVIDTMQPKSLNQTLAGLATSKAVAEQVVLELGLDQQRSADTNPIAHLRSGVKHSYQVALAYLQYGFYAESPAFEGAVERLRRSIVATPIKDSYLIEIKVQSDDPERAVLIADAVTRAFVRQSAVEFQRNASNYRSVMGEEVERARREVNDAEAALQRYKEQHAIADLAEAARLSAVDDDSLRQQLRDVESQLSSSRARHASLERTLAGLSPTERSTTSSSGQNTSSVSSTAEAGRGTTTTVNDTTTGVAENRDTVSPNRVYQEVQREALTLAAQIAGFESRRSTLAASVADRGRANAELAEHTARVNALELQRTSAHGTYNAIRASYEAAIVNDARGAEEVTQVDAASRPLYPERPLRYLFAIIGLLCGLAGGMALALVLDRWSPNWSLMPRWQPARAVGASAAFWNEQETTALTPVPVVTPGASPGRRYEI
jgi:uncharacterized protein involved in exopolysaccharide biosynthesis